MLNWLYKFTNFLTYLSVRIVIPLQTTPSPVKPGRQVHVKLLHVLLQTATVCLSVCLSVQIYSFTYLLKRANSDTFTDDAVTSEAWSTGTGVTTPRVVANSHRMTRRVRQTFVHVYSEKHFTH